MNNLVSSLMASVEHYQFLKHKEHLKQELCRAVDRLTPVDLTARFWRGEKEHGELTPDLLLQMNVQDMFSEEVADAFWYHVMREEKKKLQSLGARKNT